MLGFCHAAVILQISLQHDVAAQCLTHSAGITPNIKLKHGGQNVPQIKEAFSPVFPTWLLENTSPDSVRVVFNSGFLFSLTRRLTDVFTLSPASTMEPCSCFESVHDSEDSLLSVACAIFMFFDVEHTSGEYSFSSFFYLFIFLNKLPLE